MSREDFEKKRKEAIDSLATKKKISKAVTTLIADDGVFKEHKEGSSGVGMTIGTLMHSVLSSVCESLFYTKDHGDLDELIKKHNTDDLSPENCSDVRKMVEKVLKTDLVKKVASADRLYTEIPFMVHGEFHGVIDLVFADADGFHVIDWKSDRVDDAKRFEEIKAHYKKQINYYVKAIEETLGEKVASADCVFCRGL